MISVVGIQFQFLIGFSKDLKSFAGEYFHVTTISPDSLRKFSHQGSY
jgi:hypothetical protein